MRKSFVKDYTLDPKGGYKYTGEYYLLQIDSAERGKRSGFHILFAVVQIVLLIIAGTLNSPGSYQFAIVLPYMCILLPMLYYLLGSFRFLKAPVRMERKIYQESVIRMFRSVAAAFFLNFFVVAADGVFLLQQIEKSNAGAELIFFGIMLGLAAANYAALIYHSRMKKMVTAEKQEKETASKKTV